MRIVFIGTVEFSACMLDELVRLGANVVGVCTRQTPASNADYRDLSGACRAAGIPWIYASDINAPDVSAWIKSREPDVLFCFGWSQLIKAPLLSAAPLGVIGYHPAALPSNRGRHPIIWALVLGLTETASTFFFMDAGADSGDILSQVRVPIEEIDTARTLYDRLVARARQQLAEFVPRLASGSYPRVPQDRARANAWRKRSRQDGAIDWRMPARGVYNLVRGLSEPYPGAHFVHRGQEVKVWRAEVVSDVAPNLEPGKVLAVGPDGPVVRCGEGAIRLSRTDPVFTIDPGEYL